MIIREYRCRDCGTKFESFDADPACPSCSAEDTERAFFTPPAINSSSTRRADTIQKELAADFGMSDMSNRGGQPVRRAPAGPTAPSFGGNGKIMQNLAGLGSAADNFSQVSGVLSKGGPKPEWHFKDSKNPPVVTHK